MADTRRLELRLESKIDSVDAAELMVLGLAREAGFEQDELDRLGMAVRESMVNAIAHGNAYSRDKWVHFAVEAGPNGVQIEVRDEGAGFNPDDVPDPTVPENLLKVSGRGMLLMRALVDEFSIERAPEGGMLVRLAKRPSTGER